MTDDRDIMHADDEEASGPIARWVPAAVVTVAVTGFIMLAWYAYNAGTRSIDEESLLVVEADESPLKEKPEDPGGMQFPNQDKIIFEAFSNTEQNPPKVERLLPPPEEPIAKPQHDETTTWVNKKLQQEEQAEQQVQEAVAPPAEKTDEAEKISTEGFVRDAAVDKGQDIEKPSAITSYTQPKKTEVVLDNAVKEEKSPSAGSGNVKAQLGAYGSEKEAKSAWSSMQKKYNTILGSHDYVVVRADLAKGTFYRLRVTGFNDTAAAKTFCGKLAAKGQACIPVAQ